MDDKELLDQYVASCGGKKKIASKEIGVSPQAFSGWYTRGIPRHARPIIEGRVRETKAVYETKVPTIHVITSEREAQEIRGRADLYRAIPILQDRVAAGPPRTISPHDVEGLAVIYERWAKPGSVCLRVRGDSMVPQFHDGDLIGVSPFQGNPRELRGKLVVAWLEGDGEEGMTVKRLNFSRNFVILEAVNPAYPPTYIERGEPIQLFKVDWWWGKQA